MGRFRFLHPFYIRTIGAILLKFDWIRLFLISAENNLWKKNGSYTFDKTQAAQCYITSEVILNNFKANIGSFHFWVTECDLFWQNEHKVATVNFRDNYRYGILKLQVFELQVLMIYNM